MRPALIACLLVGLVGCKRPAPSPVADAATSAAPVAVEATPGVISDGEGRALVKGACLSCHSFEMLAQQRLTPAQWTKTVTKMVGWGANLESGDVGPLTSWLAATYGLDAGPFELAVVDADAAANEIAPEPDGPYANGDPLRGRALYTDRCSGCHGPDAKGHIGVRLVDRPGIYRAAQFAETVRRGRGKMPPMVMSEGETADVLAYLRSL